MTQGERVAAFLGLAGLGWFLYTRSKGLSLTGQYENTMLTHGAPSSMSLVTPSYATSTAATNPFGALLGAVTTSVRALLAPRNASVASSQTATGITTGDKGPPATSGIYATAGQPIPEPGTLNETSPYWMWDQSFDFVSPAAGVPELAYTLPPDANYIPPPPGQ